MIGATLDESSKYLHKVVADIKSLLRRKLSEGNLSVEDEEQICRNSIETFEHLVQEKHLPDAAFADIFDFYVFMVTFEN